MTKMTDGKRIKLDLTDFVKDSGGQRWMFVSREDFSTISDVVDRLREEHQQLGQNDLVTKPAPSSRSTNILHVIRS